MAKDPFKNFIPEETNKAGEPVINPFANFIPEEAPQPEPSVLESTLRGAAQGATLGFADELAGALAATKSTLLSPEAKSWLEEYTKERDISRAAYKEAQETSPWAYGLSELGAGVGTAFIPGGAVAKLGAGVKGGVITGGLAAAGSSEADLTKDDIGGLTSDIGAGAALGGTLALGAKGLLGLAKIAGKTHPAEKFVRARKHGLEGVNLISSEAPQKVSGELIDNIGEITNRLNVLMNGDPEKGIIGLAAKKNIAKRAAMDEGTKIDLTKTYDEMKNLLDSAKKYSGHPESIKVAEELQQKIDDIVTTTKEPIIREYLTPFSRIPSSTEELMTKATTEAAKRKAVFGADVTPETMKFKTPEGEMEQALLRSREVSPDTEKLIKEIQGEEEITKLVKPEQTIKDKIETLGSPIPVRAEQAAGAAAMFEQIGEKSVKDTANVAYSKLGTIKEDALRIAKTENLDSDVTAAAKQLVGKLSEVENQIKSIAPLNKDLVNINKALDIFGKPNLRDEFGNQMDLTSYVARVANGSISGELAKRELEKAFSHLSTLNAGLGKDVLNKLFDIVDKFSIASNIRSGGFIHFISPAVLPYFAGNAAGLVEEAVTKGPVGKSIVEGTKKGASKLGQLLKRTTIEQPRLGQVLEVAEGEDISMAMPQPPEQKKQAEYKPDEFKKWFGNLKENDLKLVADRFKSDPSLESLGRKLENAVNSGSSLEKAQAEFQIQQNTKARQLLNK